jgi:hypothetical protein
VVSGQPTLRRNGDVDPGLDLHEWETRWQELEDEARDDPTATLPEMDRLVEQMLVESGYDTEPVGAAGDDVEIVRQFLAAREITRRADAGEADPGDVADAIDAYRALYEHVTTERPGP